MALQDRRAVGDEIGDHAGQHEAARHVVVDLEHVLAQADIDIGRGSPRLGYVAAVDRIGHGSLFLQEFQRPQYWQIGLSNQACSGAWGLSAAVDRRQGSGDKAAATLGIRPDAANLLRRAAHRQPSPRQLSRCHPQLGAAAARLRLHLLHRRPACHHPVAGAGRAARPDPGGDGRLPGRRGRCAQAYRLQPEPGARPCPAGLDLQLRGADRLAEPHDPVQGEGGQGPRERLGRALCLSQPDGGRHPGL